MTAQKLHLIGNAHLDPVWLWRWQEGFAEVKATFRSALDRMKEFPDFIFTCAGAAYYRWVEENAPEMFEEIRQRVSEGRWAVVGGWWIQPDCNIPMGEAFARHSLYSQRYFQEKFGVTAKVGYNVDSFGHSGMLPQILKKSGMDYYVFMRPGDAEKELPGNLFRWESEDGSSVLTYKIPFEYNHSWSPEKNSPETVLAAIRQLGESQGNDMMAFYGVGNHGGGPTIASIKMLQQLQKEWGLEKLIFSSPDRYFEEVSRENPDTPLVKGDLQHHASGCYSAVSEIKALNRRAEHRLLTAEKFSAAAEALLAFEGRQGKLKEAWEGVLFNQFHDIMGGCSIKEAYQDAYETYGRSLSIGAELLNAACQKISWSIDTMCGEERFLSKEKDGALWEDEGHGTPLVVFNPLSWEVFAPIHVNKHVQGVADEEGNAAEIQTVRASRTNGSRDKWDSLFMAKIPALGYRVYWLYKNNKLEAAKSENILIAENHSMENDWLSIRIDPHTGYIAKLFDKSNQVDVLSGLGAVPVVIDEYDSDTWAHRIFEFRRETGRFNDASVKLIENGGLRATFRAVGRYGDSVIQQDFTLYKHKPGLEVKVRLDWREKHKMLKLSFPVNVLEPRAVYEIPYGFIERPADGREEPGQQWVDVSGIVPGEKSTYGLALLNDCKYSFDVKGGDLRMTAVRSPIYADHYGERDEFCEFTDQGIHEFVYQLIPHAGGWNEGGVVKRAYELNVRPEQILETYHAGKLPRKFEGMEISADNIIAVAFKKSEDGKGYILRAYESEGKAVSAAIHLPVLGRTWKADFGRCEIKTFYIPSDCSEEIFETDMPELSRPAATP